MKNFQQYLEVKKYENQNYELATLLVESDIDINQFCTETLALAKHGLNEEEIINELASGLWNAASGLAGRAWQGVKNVGQGIAQDYQAGEKKTTINNAIQSIEKLRDMLQQMGYNVNYDKFLDNMVKLRTKIEQNPGYQRNPATPAAPVAKPAPVAASTAAPAPLAPATAAPSGSGAFPTTAGF